MKKILIYCLFILSINTFADEAKTTEDNSVEKESTFEQRRIDRLKRIRIDLIQLKSKINDVKKTLEADIDMVSKIQNEAKLAQLEREYNKNRFLFIETATNINLSVDRKKQKKSDFMDDVKQILEPALNSVKQISERPREIQELKERIDVESTRYEGAVEAKDEIERLFKEGKEKVLGPRYKASISMLNKLIGEQEVKLEDLEYKLLNLEKNEKSIVSTFSGLIFEFFKTKGKNLGLAFIVFISFFWLFKTGQNRFLAIILFRQNQQNKDFYQWMSRPIKVIYNALGTLMSFFFAILTLYVLNDWVLVTFIIFVLAALVWSSKQYLPLFMEQSKIVLNLGAIREEERLFYQGLPWKIDSLGYYCRLSNPSLEGGSMRVNTKELLSSNSRKIIPNEPWFPTKKNDWVEVEDVFGQVTLQTSEQVIIKKVGGENKFYKTDEFYGLKPENLSLGFSIEFNFGIDYSHQSSIVTEIIPNIQNELTSTLYNKHSDLKHCFEQLTVEFVNAGASSLDLRFFLKCDGEIAAKKKFLYRSIQVEFINLCNKYEYIIPFNQLTVHMSNE